jgi:hypothetical protein
VLLVLALIAVLVGILFLYLEMAVCDFKFQGGPPVSMITTQESRVASCSGTAVVHFNNVCTFDRFALNI